MRPYPQPPDELFRDLNARPELESNLRAKFRSYHRTRRLKAWTVAACTAAAALILVWNQPSRQAASPQFQPLPGTTITQPMLESAQIVRVELSPAALAQLGLAAQSEPVEAELLLTQDGLARGIRFLQ